MTESELQREIAKTLSPLGHRVFRNNIGNALLIEHRDPGYKQTIIQACIRLAEQMGGSGYRVRYGLVTGASDQIGWTNRGLFLAIETKSAKGRLTPEQANFLEQVRKAGGVGACARSVEEALEALR